MRRRTFMLSGGAALASSCIPAMAADWPLQPVTIVVPFDAGGSADRLARGFAQYMPKYLGTPMTVVDRAGASGMTGTDWLLAQPADGYTVMLTAATPFIPTNILAANAHFTLDDFTFVNAQWTDYTALLVPKDRPWRTAGELIDAIRANPGKISTGVVYGSIGHISTLALLAALRLPPSALHFVTFDAADAMHAALPAGQIDFYITQAEALVDKRSDFVRPLAIFLDHRVPEYDVPPINAVLRPYHASVPLLSGSVRSFVFPAAFKAKHPADYAKFVTAYRTTLNASDFQKFLKDNHMAGDWVGEESTTRIIRSSFNALKKYKGLLKK